MAQVAAGGQFKHQVGLGPVGLADVEQADDVGAGHGPQQAGLAQDRARMSGSRQWFSASTLMATSQSRRSSRAR